MAISHVNAAVLAQTSREGVESRFPHVHAQWAHDRWLPTANRYAVDPIKSLEADLAAGAYQPDEMADYIAASAIPHCVDGWSYFGRALSALMTGDPHAARHLAYYAELRAAMAVLATEGIGVFNDRHIAVFESTRAPISEAFPTPVGTHAFAWEAFDAWAQEARSVELLTRIVRIDGETLEDWIAALPTTTTVVKLLQTQFLRQWGLDLKTFEEDRSTRNLFSYRPTAIHQDGPPLPSEIVAFAKTIWELSEPMGEARFRMLDRFILRRVVQQHLRHTFGEPKNAAIRGQYQRTVEQLLDSVSAPVEMTREAWVQFLLAQVPVAEPNPLAFAGFPATVGRPAAPLNVISRAFLLLRLASGACYDLLNVIRPVCSPADDLSFWWHALGERRGLWALGGAPDDASDLWADVRGEVERLGKAIAGGLACIHDFQANCDSSITTLGGTERIGFWGLGL